MAVSSRRPRETCAKIACAGFRGERRRNAQFEFALEVIVGVGDVERFRVGQRERVKEAGVRLERSEHAFESDLDLPSGAR